MDNKTFKANLKPREAVIGFVLLAVLLVLAGVILQPLVAVRFLIGLGFGYVLARAFTGFAGSVNRACRTGSTQLMRALVLLFFITAVIVAAFAYQGFDSLDLWVNKINLGLILGAIIFGFGMSLSSCCASGVLTDLATASPRALITIIFFGIGVLVGLPVQNTQSWTVFSWLSTERGAQKGGGVFFPDLFKWDGFDGYLGAIILTGILCLVVYAICMRYEKKRKAAGTLTEVGSEVLQRSPEDYDVTTAKFFSKDTYYHIFVKPFTLIGGAIGIAIMFTLILAVFRSEWGASMPLGLWIARILMKFGVTSEKLAIFTHATQKTFETPFLMQQVSMQNVGILFGAAVYQLMAGNYMRSFKDEIRIGGKDALLYILGGFTMGFGTRLANGCNAGALLSPIAAFSLSGWIFLIFMTVGGVIGNRFRKKVL